MGLRRRTGRRHRPNSQAHGLGINSRGDIFVGDVPGPLRQPPQPAREIRFRQKLTKLG